MQRRSPVWCAWASDLQVVREAAGLDDVVIAALVELLAEEDVAAHGVIYDPGGLPAAQASALLTCPNR